jgi:hypothetical protein
MRASTARRSAPYLLRELRGDRTRARTNQREQNEKQWILGGCPDRSTTRAAKNW